MLDIKAGDQSGIAQVTLYCDGKEISSQSEEPYVWLHRPGKGFHTYKAVAIDASPNKNERTSFKRTIEVGAKSSW